MAKIITIIEFALDLITPHCIALYNVHDVSHLTLNNAKKRCATKETQAHEKKSFLRFYGVFR